jgi:hypothetical protein
MRREPGLEQLAKPDFGDRRHFDFYILCAIRAEIEELFDRAAETLRI